MNPFFAYLIKSSISLALLYVLFRLVMRKDKAHTLNRFLLLGLLLFSAVIPFLNIQFFTKEVAVQPVEKLREFISTPVFAPETAVAENLPAEEAGNFAFNPYLILYAAIILVLLTHLFISIIRVLQLIKKAQKQKLRNIVLAVVKDFIQPFTFLDKIVLSERDFNENKDIVVAHEHAHIKQLHAIDLVVCELFLLLHFFNPFMWLLRRDLKLVHEYQADQAVLQKGIDAKKYQLLVLEKAVGERRFALANHFTQKPILERFKMMKKRKKSWSGLKLMFFVPVLILLLQAFARPELITKPDDFVPIKYTENKTEQWLQKWTLDNIGKGFYDPVLESPDAPKKPNNVLLILMNTKNQYLIENQKAEKEDIKQIVKNYLLGINPDGGRGPDYSEEDIPYMGKMKVSKGSIVYQNALQSSNEMINYTLRAFGEACLEVRNNKAQILFGKDYFDLNKGKMEAVNTAVPIRFTYKSPKPPTPSVWLPFDRKPSKPDPIKMTFKGNGNVLVENHKFNSFEEFEENLKYWNKDLDEYNKDRRSKAFYRADVIFEDIPRSEQKNVSYILYKNNVHV
ncbi:MAG TPA: M56 family metallopeptidase [Draconibacterium sp.]|nr:M56 family metallopeptidase [Draconibacterium sp.]